MHLHQLRLPHPLIKREHGFSSESCLRLEPECCSSSAHTHTMKRQNFFCSIQTRHEVTNWLLFIHLKCLQPFRINLLPCKDWAVNTLQLLHFIQFFDDALRCTGSGWVVWMGTWNCTGCPVLFSDRATAGAQQRFSLILWSSGKGRLTLAREN